MPFLLFSQSLLLNIREIPRPSCPIRLHIVFTGQWDLYIIPAYKAQGTQRIGSRYVVRARGWGGDFCKTMYSNHNRTTALINSQKLCLPVQAKKPCTMEEIGTHRPYSLWQILMVNGCWGRERQFSSGLWPLLNSPFSISIQEAIIWLSRWFVLFLRECEVGRGL